jgi:hypothetical protein
MRAYPKKISVQGKAFYFEKILKDDFFSVNVLYKDPEEVRWVLKLSDFRFFLGSLLKPLAMFFSWREYKIYKTLDGIEGIPTLGPRFGKRGYLHKFVEGRTLHELEQHGGALPDDFFPGLENIISQVHERRIFYLDLNKRGNIILGDDGRPYLIDFQVCLRIGKRRGLSGLIADRVFNGLIREDIYHLYKHKRYFQPHLMTQEELSRAKRTRFNEGLNRYVGSPYRKVKRLIYPHGSNEIVWYKWKKMKDRSTRMP